MSIVVVLAVNLGSYVTIGDMLFEYSYTKTLNTPASSLNISTSELLPRDSWKYVNTDE